MEPGVIEVTNSMSPQGVFIGNVSEVASETQLYSENCNSPIPSLSQEYVKSSLHGQGVGLSLSPTSKFPEEDFSSAENEIPYLDLNSNEEDRVIAEYTTKMNLTELVIKKLSQSNKNVIDVISAYDSEKNGVVSIQMLKKCLNHYSLSLNESEFQMVFGSFIENGNVNYIHFLKSWTCFIVEPDVCYSRKRSWSEEEEESNTSMSMTINPKRRLVSLTSSFEDESVLQDQISTLIIQHFGNYQGIFKELAVNNLLYISDFYDYLIKHEVSCSFNQLIRLLKPYGTSMVYLTIEEFQKFINHLTGIQTTSDKLVEAFPQTFGYSTRISLTKDTNSVGEYGLHRTASVAQNLNSLPLYRLMLTLNEDTFQPQENDAIFV